MFYDRFIELCAQKKVPPSRAAIEAGLSKSTVTKWKNNADAEPSGAVIKKLADYFGVPRYAILGEQENAESDLPTNNNEEAALDEELISRLVQLTPEEQAKVDAFVYGLLAARGAGTFRQASGG